MTTADVVGSSKVVLENLRLVAILLLVESDPPYGGQELLDEILDMPCQKAHGRPMRFCSDLDTKWHIIVTAGAGRFSVVEVQARALFQFPVLFGAGVLDWEKVLWATFNHFGVPGCAIEQWAPEPIATSPILRCGKCGKVYDLTSNAGVVSADAYPRSIAEHGGSLEYVRDGQIVDAPTILRDLVMSATNIVGFKDMLADVVEGLMAGKARRWQCERCEHCQGYPGSFFRHTFTPV